MQIQKIKLNNFYCFKSSEIDFTKYKGIVRILGVNKDSGGSNGSGKSTVFEGIVWGLFGKTIRKSSEEALVASFAGSNCFVELTLFKPGVGDIVINRSKRPTSLNVIVNGVNQSKENATETQKHIESILETDYKSFLAAIVFGQHSDYSFLDSSPEEKRTIIRNCFNLDDLFVKREAVKVLKSGFTSEQKVVSTLIKSLSDEKAQLEKNLPNNKYKLIDLPPLDEILKAEAKIAKNCKDHAALSDDYNNNRKQLQKLLQLVSKGVYEEKSPCPICKSDYSTKQTEEDLTRLANEIEFLKGVQEGILKSKNALVEENKTLKPAYTSSEWAKYNDKNNIILQAKYFIDKHAETVLKLEEYTTKLATLEKQIEVMKFWEKAFSEQGMIKYIIRNILDYFNLKTNEYLSILTNSQFTIEFNDELLEVIKNNNIPTKYISLSGGEKRKVNLSIMLALQDLSSKISKTNCNLIFFDEVCDNIDDLGIEAINNLLTFISEHSNKVILLITHNNYLQGLLSETQKITVVKQQGITRTL